MERQQEEAREKEKEVERKSELEKQELERKREIDKEKRLEKNEQSNQPVLGVILPPKDLGRTEEPTPPSFNQYPAPLVNEYPKVPASLDQTSMNKELERYICIFSEFPGFLEISSISFYLKRRFQSWKFLDENQWNFLKSQPGPVAKNNTDTIPRLVFLLYI